LHVFRQAGPPQWVDCLAPKWETVLSVFPKDTVMRYRIGSRTKVLQPFDYLINGPCSCCSSFFDSSSNKASSVLHYI